MLKRKNVVLTRDQLNEAKRLHQESFDAFVKERKEKFESDIHKGWTDKTRFVKIMSGLKRPKTMNQCVKEVLTGVNS